MGWPSAFVAVGSLLGEPLDALVDSLGAAAGDAGDIARTLRSSSRETRARALARELSEVAAAIEQARMRY